MNIKINQTGYHIFVNFNEKGIDLHQLNKDLALALEHTIKHIGKMKGEG